MMTLLEDLYDLNSQKPLEITKEKLLEAESYLQDKINGLGEDNDSEDIQRYLRRKQMLVDLKFEFNRII